MSPVGIEVCEIVWVEVAVIVVRDEENEVDEDVNEPVLGLDRIPTVLKWKYMSLEAQHEVFPVPQQNP